MYGETLWKRGDAGTFAVLARGLMQYPSLTEINLRDNQIDGRGAERLARLVNAWTVRRADSP